ncbi:choice-of-anchor D domain-containing protein, partial [Candidatus Marinimicrobia bacterium MT.SAG.2]
TLIVSDITTTTAEFTASPTAFALSPEGTQEINVVLLATTVGPVSGILSIFSNDPDEPEFTVALSGEGVIPPDIMVTPALLSDSLVTGDTSTRTITIENTGGSDLSFEINTRETGLDMTILDLISSEDYIQLNKSAPMGRIGFYADESRESSASLPALPKGQLMPLNSVMDIGDVIEVYDGFIDGNVGIVWVENELYVVDYLFAKLVKYDTANRTIIDVFPLHLDPYGIAWDGQYFWIGAPSGNVYGYDLDGNMIGSFSTPFVELPALTWDGINFIVYPAFNFRSTFYVVDFTGEVIETFDLSFDAAPYQMVWVEEHSSMWVSDPEFGRIVRVSLENGEARLVDEFAFFDDNGGYSISHDGTDLWWSDWEGPLYQIDDGIKEGAFWISVFPDTGTVSAGSSADITLTFDADRLFGGDYDADVVITSNDPDEPVVIVPTHLTVTGIPDIRIPNNVLLFGEAFVSFPSTMPLTIVNEGTDTLNITNVTSSNPDFSPEVTSASIPARSSHDIQISLTPSAEGFIFGVLTVESNDSDEGSIDIALLGEGVPAPEIEITPDSLFADLFTGEIDSQTVTIANIGAGDLFFDLSIDLLLDSIPPFEIVSEGGGEVFSKTSFRTNETSTAIFDILMSEAVVKSSSAKAYSDALKSWSEMPTGMVFRKNNRNMKVTAGSPFQYAYIANSFDNNVAVIDVTSNEIVGNPISVGGFPWRLTISPSAEQVWVSNRDTDNITVIETSSNTVIGTITAGDGPTGIVFSPDGSKAYVANRWSSSVIVYDAGTFDLEGTITSSISGPQDLAITPDGDYLYVLNISQGVTVIETAENSFVTNIALPSPSSTHTIKMSPDGSMLYLTYSGVVVIDVETNSIIADIGGFSNPHGLDFTPDGKLVFVMDKFNSAVKIIETTDHTVVSSISDSRFSSGWGLAIEPDGVYAYVTNPFDLTNSIVIIDIATTSIAASLSSGSGARGIATFRPFFPFWLDAEPTTSIVAPNSSIDIKVTFDAEGLFGGNYLAEIGISSNDPREVEETTIPVRLKVTGAPDAVLSTDTLDFRGVFIGYGDTLSLRVSNVGTDSLTVTDISSNIGEVTVVGPTSFMLLPREKHEVSVSVLATSAGSLSGTLSILSNDPDEPTLMVTVLAEALIPPVHLTPYDKQYPDFIRFPTSECLPIPHDPLLL